MAKFLLLIISIFSFNSFALPVDISGKFGVDTIRVENYRRSVDSQTQTNGSYAIASSPANESDAIFQTYLFTLNPTIIVNDSVSIMGELSAGQTRGGYFGDNTTITQNNTNGFGAASTYNTTSAGSTDLNVNQLYARVYGESALMVAGRYAKHWGLGVVFDDGKDHWDRFASVQDGFEFQFKFGRFSLVPYWSKIYSGNEQTGGTDVREIGISGLYDNPDKDMQFGVLWSRRKSEDRNTLLYSNQSIGSSQQLGQSSLTLIDIFISKAWEKWSIAFEVPMLSGDLGNVYDSSTESSLSAQAIIGKIEYDNLKSWKIGTLFGKVSGDDGSSDTFEAFKTNPNFQIAEIMFRYDLQGASNANRNIFNGGVTNAQFVKLYNHYTSGNWTWNLDLIMAKAEEAASNGSLAYHHEDAYRFTAAADQDDDLGFEADVGFNYKWNPNMTFSGFFAYYTVGDFYKFSNTANELNTKNVYASGLRLLVDF